MGGQAEPVASLASQAFRSTSPVAPQHPVPPQGPRTPILLGACPGRPEARLQVSGREERRWKGMLLLGVERAVPS